MSTRTPEQIEKRERERRKRHDDRVSQNISVNLDNGVIEVKSNRESREGREGRDGKSSRDVKSRDSGYQTFDDSFDNRINVRWQYSCPQSSLGQSFYTPALLPSQVNNGVIVANSPQASAPPQPQNFYQPQHPQPSQTFYQPQHPQPSQTFYQPQHPQPSQALYQMYQPQPLPPTNDSGKVNGVSALVMQKPYH